MSRKREQHCFVLNFCRFKHIVLASNIHGTVAKLLLWQMFTTFLTRRRTENHSSVILSDDKWYIRLLMKCLSVYSSAGAVSLVVWMVGWLVGWCMEAARIDEETSERIHQTCWCSSSSSQRVRQRTARHSAHLHVSKTMDGRATRMSQSRFSTAQWLIDGDVSALLTLFTDNSGTLGICVGTCPTCWHTLSTQSITCPPTVINKSNTKSMSSRRHSFLRPSPNHTLSLILLPSTTVMHAMMSAYN